MSSEQEISAQESKLFRKLRVLWALSFALAALAMVARIESAVWLFAAAYFALSIYVLFWLCPRCQRFFCLKFGLMSVAWPFFNECMHCGARFHEASHERGGT
ncbi:MAG: hypothetical protein ABIO74_03360 [Dokdonella sp.]